MTAIYPKDFNRNNVVFGKIRKITIKGDEGGNIPMICCDIKYRLNGELTDLIFISYKCRTQGISRKYPMNHKGQKTETNMTGFEIAINLTTTDTMNNPTDEEQAVLSMLDEMRELLLAHAISKESQRMLKSKAIKRPGLARKLITTEEEKGGEKEEDGEEEEKEKFGIDVINPVYLEPSTFIKDNQEITSPHKIWGIKIPTYRNLQDLNNPLSINTVVIGPGDKPMSPNKLIINPLKSTAGQVECAIQIKSVWFGESKMKIQLSCLNINYYPYSASVKLPRYLPANTAPLQKEEDETDDLVAALDADLETEYNPQVALDDDNPSSEPEKEESPEPPQPEREQQPTRTRIKRNVKVNVSKA